MSRNIIDNNEKEINKAKGIESIFTPVNFISDLLDMEWKNAEKNGGMTIMGKTIKGVTRGITSMINPVLYGKQAKS